jgi:Phage protein Gp138 N-terminal domain
MDADGLASVQEDQELAATPEEIARVAATEALVDVHTTLPGIVVSFDRTTQTAKVQPAIKRLWRDGGWRALPECVDCPVQFPRYGNFVITGPVSPSDEGVLHFSERSIDNWWARGGVQEQCEMRMHDLSDGFFSPGYSSKGRVPANIATDAIEIRTLDGSTVMRVAAGMVTAGDVAAAVAAVRADLMNVILAALKTHTHVVTGVTGSPGNPIVAAATPSLQLASLPDPSAHNVKIS